MSSKIPDKVIIAALGGAVFVVLIYAVVLMGKSNSTGQGFGQQISTTIASSAKQKCGAGSGDGGDERRTCRDTDQGENFIVKGTTTSRILQDASSIEKKTDTCVGDKLTEYYCDENRMVASLEHTCSKGCVENKGRCKENPLGGQSGTDCDCISSGGGAGYPNGDDGGGADCASADCGPSGGGGGAGIGGMACIGGGASSGQGTSGGGLGAGDIGGSGGGY